ncbi:cryptochrome/photolyase family protein [Terasakiella pusilla]|uniref:cryptochrome/photolyase family protein n=1 Tax=Terasakiella pusilla TaxID=64973 RepID=UPI003AA9CADE
MANLIMILGDQLSRSISSLDGAQPGRDILFLCEVAEEATYVKHHPKKIALIFSAMRHFAQDLRAEGFTVHYRKLYDPDNKGSFTKELEDAVARYSPDKIILTEAGEWRVQQTIQTWQEDLGVPVEVRADTRFLATLDEFAHWASGRKQLRMEYFYREMRKKHAILMDKGSPTGGKWNYDHDNREKPSDQQAYPAPFHVPPDEITQEVLSLVENRFSDHFGTLEDFHYAVDRTGARAALDHFIQHNLPTFGTYQDAMVQGQPWMFHSHISFYLNIGLLEPLECIKAAEQAYHDNHAPLNCVEGFIRQILGWREFVRGIYWLKMPDYADENTFNATRDLPAFYWTGQTMMNCLRQCVLDTRQHAYAHHIQRLMVLGNFALLSGIDPKQVNEWFLIVYADAFEWVEMPNVTGMALFADGGLLASKPYASSGAYIQKMSNYCDRCSFDVRKKNGPKACPFNYLYWDFLDRNRDQLSNNHRLGMIYKSYERMTEEKKQAIKDDSVRFLSSLD